METTVHEIMTTEVVTLMADDTLRLAYDMMSVASLRFFPVLESDKVIGVVSWADVMRASLSSAARPGNQPLRDFLSGVSIKDAILAPATTISPDTTAKEAARIMVDKHLECLIVLEQNTLVGIVTKTDFLREFAKGRPSSS